MSDETENPDENNANQDDVDAIMDDGSSDSDETGSMGGMDLDEITGDDSYTTVDQEFAPGEPMAGDVTAIYDIPVQISAVLGRSTMQVSQLLKLGRGAVVELDRKVGEAIDIYVNNRLVARGEVVVVEDKLGITMTEIVKSDRN